MIRGDTVASLALIAATGLCLIAAGCGTKTPGAPSTTASTTAASTTPTRGRGPVSVLYAGSLEDTMNNTIGPAFERATGYTFVGFPDGSSALEADIKGRIKQADVFISASPKADEGLEGASNGSWVTWYATFADTAVVLGYNTHSRFAGQLETQPWYRVVGERGFKLGFTNPSTDPKGVLSVKALRTAASQFDEPRLDTIALDTKNQYPEASLVGQLQSGQLDAAFFYTVEATAAKIPYVSLKPISEPSPYTVTVLEKAAHPAGAVAFVSFLLGPPGRALSSKLALANVSPPQVSGTGVPPALSSVIPTA